MRNLIENRLNNYMARLIILILIILPFCQTAYSQQGDIIDKGLFNVYKIDNSFIDFHLIFIKNSETNYTIYSERSILVKGQEIKKGQEYYFELVRKIDTLATGQVITPMNYLDISYFGGKYSGTQTGMICYAKNLKGLVMPEKTEIKPVDSDKSISGVFTQQMFYRFTIVEFKRDRTFNYHIMSERAHRQTSGKYVINGDTIILNSYQANSDFDFVNKKWILLNKKQIVTSGNLNDKKENWSILEKGKHLDSIPTQRSDLALKIDSIKINELSWIKDTTNYDSELKLINHEPLPPKEPVVLINGIPVKYDFLLDYYSLSDIDSLTFMTGEKLIDSGIHGGQAMNGLILITTNNKNRNANRVGSR